MARSRLLRQCVVELGRAAGLPTTIGHDAKRTVRVYLLDAKEQFVIGGRGTRQRTVDHVLLYPRGCKKAR